jgi:hypothetical protein
MSRFTRHKLHTSIRANTQKKSWFSHAFLRLFMIYLLVLLALLVMVRQVWLLFPSVTTTWVDKTQEGAGGLQPPQKIRNNNNNNVPPNRYQSCPPAVVFNCSQAIHDKMGVNYNYNSTGLSSSSSSFYKPLWVPGFPGSGSELFRTLVEKMTGMRTAGPHPLERKSRSKAECWNQYATYKTHCPIGRPCPDPSTKHQYHTNSILLLRNPQSAIPSYINFLWEADQYKKQQQRQQQAGSGNTSNNRLQSPNTTQHTHNRQAPMEYWIRQRDASLVLYLKQWKRTLHYWTSTFPAAADAAVAVAQPVHPASLVVPYEHLVHAEQGPLLLQQVAKELQQAHVPVMVATTTTPNEWECLWYSVVRASKSTTKRSQHNKYSPPYTRQQQTDMIRMLKNLQTKWTTRTSRSTNWSALFAQYQEEIVTHMILEGD